jgi:hypothetical protein
MQNQFVIDYNGQSYTIEPLILNGTTVYRVYVNGQLAILTRSIQDKDNETWVSIPDGEHPIANLIGQLIDKKLAGNSK